ncbi:MAG: hypothetical protein H7A35_15130 [Planctomycetales bacterium]|nr:hypothetical protein [bacterium]UNM08163.1 MAG: hypothetical protein H7A35_15130 [Planctomycetales bacterium]
MARGKKFDLSALPIRVVYSDEPMREEALRDAMLALMTSWDNCKSDMRIDDDN